MQLSSCFPFVGNAISRITSIVQSFSLFPKMPILAFVMRLKRTNSIEAFVDTVEDACELMNFSPTADDGNKLDLLAELLLWIKRSCLLVSKQRSPLQSTICLYVT